ncbi:MAG: sialidase family protein [Acidobacteriota bacterium]
MDLHSLVMKLVASALLLTASLLACVSEPVEPSGVDWVNRIDVAAGGAHQGPWRGNQSEFHYVDDPTVTVDGEGAVAVAWVDQVGKDVVFQAFDPEGVRRFETPVNVSRSPAVFSWLPKMVTPSDDPDAVYVLWQEIVFSGGTHGGDIFFARSTDAGKSFDEPINLSNSLAGDGKGRLTRKYWHNGSLDLAIGPAGTLLAAWTEYEGRLWLSRSTDGGQSFSEPLHVAGGDEAPARGPSLAVGSDGDLFLAWTVREDEVADIHLTRSTDAGLSFDAPWTPVESDGHPDGAKISVDPEGTVHLAYVEGSGSLLDRHRIRYTRSTDGARSFEQPREMSSSLPREIEGGSFPALSLDGQGAVFLVWELHVTGSFRPRGLGFTVSRDGGRTFAAPSVIPGSAEPELGENGSRQGALMKKLAVDATGRIAVVNSTFLQDEASHVWLYRGELVGR